MDVIFRVVAVRYTGIQGNSVYDILMLFSTQYPVFWVPQINNKDIGTIWKTSFILPFLHHFWLIASETSRVNWDEVVLIDYQVQWVVLEMENWIGASYLPALEGDDVILPNSISSSVKWEEERAWLIWLLKHSFTKKSNEEWVLKTEEKALDKVTEIWQ